MFRGCTAAEWSLLRRRWSGRGRSGGRHGHGPGQGATVEGVSSGRSGDVSSSGAGGGVGDGGTHMGGFTRNISAPLLGSFPFSFWNSVQTPSSAQTRATVRAAATGNTASDSSATFSTAAANPTGSGTSVAADRHIGTERPQSPRQPGCVRHTAVPVDRNTKGSRAGAPQPAKDVVVHSARSGDGVEKATEGMRGGGEKRATGIRRVSRGTVGGRDEANIREIALRLSERVELDESDRISSPVLDGAVPAPGLSSMGGSGVGAGGGVKDCGEVKSRISSGVVPGTVFGHDLAPAVMVPPVVLPLVAKGATAGRRGVEVNRVSDMNDGRSGGCVGGDCDDVAIVRNDDANRGPARCSSPSRYPVGEHDDGVVPAVTASGGGLSFVVMHNDDETKKEQADDGGLSYHRHHGRPLRER